MNIVDLLYCHVLACGLYIVEFRVREGARLRGLAVVVQQGRVAYNHWRDPVPDHILHSPPPPPSSSSAAGSKELLPGDDKSPEEVAAVAYKTFATFIKDTKVTRYIVQDKATTHCSCAVHTRCAHYIIHYIII
jgi:hypothetical protein